MYLTLFTLISVFGALYFLTSKRRFDYFTVAYASALIYFLPGFFGYTGYFSNVYWIETSIHDEAYLVMIAVIASIWLSGYIGTYVKNPISLNIQIPNPQFIVYALLALSFFGLLALLATLGDKVHSADKNVILEDLGRWHILFVSATTLGLPISYATKKYRASLAFLVLLCFDLYLGFRSALAVGTMSVIAIHLGIKSKSRVGFSELKAIFIALVLAVFFFLYKQISFAVKAGMWDLVLERLSEGESYILMITNSEPFLIQNTLNEVISKDFRVEVLNVFSAVNQLILFGPELGLETTSFNSLFQPTLFPSIEYGMASNIWAQMWSAGGWPLLLIFIMLFNLVIAFGNATLRSASLVVRGGFAAPMLYWSFYIHRNDLAYALNIEKRLVLILVLCVAFAYVSYFLRTSQMKAL